MLPVEREEIIAALRAFPDRVEALCRDLSEEELRRPPAPGEWSILEVCCHLRDAAQIEGERIRRLLEEEGPTLEPYDPEALARERGYEREDSRRVLTALRAFWGGLAYQLEGLPAEAWGRSGTHPEAGPVTVEGRAHQAVRHAHEHLEQIQAIREGLGRG